MPSPTQIEGARQENIAEAALRLAGYRIEERNWRGGGGEIDRIAWDGEVLAFVEIRARGTVSHGEPAETVRGAKQRRLIRASAAYMMRFPSSSSPPARFDVVSIVFVDPALGKEPKVDIIKDAFEADAFGGGGGMLMV